jgi:hypothetical protein
LSALTPIKFSHKNVHSSVCLFTDSSPLNPVMSCLGGLEVSFDTVGGLQTVQAAVNLEKLLDDEAGNLDTVFGDDACDETRALFTISVTGLG